MFASKVHKTQTKALENSFSEMPERSPLLSHRLGHDPFEQALFLQRTIENQAILRPMSEQTSRQRGGAENKITGETSRGASWDLSKIPVFPPDGLGSSSQPGIIQRKLVVGKPNDPLEDEADRVAAQVVQMSAAEVSSAPVRLSRKCMDCEEEERRTLQPKRASAPAITDDTAPNEVYGVLRSPGRPLDKNSATFFGARFGHDFTRVRVHSDSDAAESAKRVRARAYTIGNHIVFGSGEYAPATDAGRGLLAHELAHVVQQAGGHGWGVVQRREVDDRSCAGLSDVESEVDREVNTEIAAARTAAGTTPFALLPKVWDKLGKGSISPIEKFIEKLPAAERKTPARDLAGTKYSGTVLATVAKSKLLALLPENPAVASAVNVHGHCIGADKLGHFFDVGFAYWAEDVQHGMSTAKAQDFGRGLEIGVQGLSAVPPLFGGPTGVFSNADQEANLKGWQFYKDLAADPAGYVFAIANYIAANWNERINPSFYEPGLAKDVWNNLLTGQWRGTIGFGSSQADIQFDLTAATGGVTGSYEYPVGAAKPNKGTITNGIITQQTRTVAGQIPGDPVTSATAVTGISIEFTWHRGSSSGKGILKSVDEQTLEGTWGRGSATSGGGALRLNKA
jgi:Domain of unknown function (DUF4157)